MIGEQHNKTVAKLVWKDKDGNTLDSVYRTQLE